MPGLARPLVALLLLILSTPALGQQAWLVTYGSAERIEEQFGHNAIWIRDPSRNIDAVYNFGFFDFDKPGFYREFIFGEMIYYALARSPEDELVYYRWRDRDVRAQLLNLSPEQVDKLTDWLETRVQPDMRNFRYNYYFYNCSNRVRDALDFALNGALSNYAKQRPARMTFREHTRRMLADDPLLYIATQAALGRPADRPRTLWEEMFLPAVVAETIGEMEIGADSGPNEPLVIADRTLYESSRPEDPSRPNFAWGLTLSLIAASFALIFAPVALARRGRWAFVGARAWIVVLSLGGVLLAFLWLATDHEMAWRNENLLLFNPLTLLLIRFGSGRLEKVTAALVAIALILALGLKFLPNAQWNYELLLWLVPTQAALLYLWGRRSWNDSQRPGGYMREND